MLTSLIEVLHAGLPCTDNFMYLKQLYLESIGVASPRVKQIASPNILSGFSLS
jgi:hypothetical protein